MSRFHSLLILLILAKFGLGNEQCSCSRLSLVSSSSELVSVHNQLLGTYNRRTLDINNKPSYEHVSNRFWLFFDNQQNGKGTWSVVAKQADQDPSNSKGNNALILENAGQTACPYRLKSLWRYSSDEDSSLMQYDNTLKVLCLEDACSVANCGHQALCVAKENKTGEFGAECRCKDNFEGNAYERCYPKPEILVKNGLKNDKINLNETQNITNEEEENIQSVCKCRRLILSSSNDAALAKHGDSLGEFFLYDIDDRGWPVYEHFSGTHYLYRHGQTWLVSDALGQLEAGLQNQGDASNVCVYHLKSAWEYADTEQPGWQWVYDYSADISCPSDKCSVRKCGFNADCNQQTGECACNEGFEGNPLDRCLPKLSLSSCTCRELLVTSLGASALTQADKMGRYFLFSEFNNRPVYQHQSGLDYLFFASGRAWVIGAKLGGARVGVVNFDDALCPYEVNRLWQHSMGGALETDESLVVDCNDFHADANLTQLQTSFQQGPPSFSQFRPFAQTKSTSTTTTASTTTFTTSTATITTPRETIWSASAIETTVKKITNSTLRPKFTTKSSFITTTFTTARTTKFASIPTKKPLFGPTPIGANRPTNRLTTKTTSVTTTASSTTTTPEIFDTPCRCSVLLVNSSNPATLAKHGHQLGEYLLVDAVKGRPVYKHSEQDQYLYYHPGSGGNWLINAELGRLFGGIQNSKDYPLCPYLINTLWQYGDSSLGGWVYDPTLTVVCPSDICSILKCGFRARCLSSEQRCACQEGFEGDPYNRCFPVSRRLEGLKCNCRHLRMSTDGPAGDHQRDKMGDYYLWGGFNDRPVYQHQSGLDFLYFHNNQVWGVGPQIGGNSAGLLNLERGECPYQLRSPWEYGTRSNSDLRRRLDYDLSLICVDKMDSEKDDHVMGGDQLGLVQLGGPANCGLRVDSNNRWIAAIALQLEPNSLRHLCTGIVISKVHVLTSATCLAEYPMSRYRVIAGQKELHNGAEAIALRAINFHPSENLAMVKVATDLGENVLPVCIRHPIRNANRTVEQCELSTWTRTWSAGGAGSGRSGVTLKSALANTQQCLTSLSKAKYCVRTESPHFPCALDRGAPLVCQDNDQQSFYVAGIMGDGASCGRQSDKFVVDPLDVQWVARLISNDISSH